VRAMTPSLRIGARQGGNVGIRTTVAVALTLAALALATAACGGSGDSGGPSSGGGTETYANDKYGFSITYDTLLTQGRPSAGTGSGPGSAFDIAFVDTGGTDIDGEYIDGIRVSVYELTRAVKPDEVPQLKPQADGVVAQLMDSLPSAQVTEPLQDVEIDGVPGFTISYTFTQQEVDVTAASYFLFSGTYEYELTEQASRQDWAKLRPVLDAAIQSFTVK